MTDNLEAKPETPSDVDSISQSQTDFGFIPIPKRLRYDPDRPFHFGMTLNIAFGFASTFTVANLYYCQPILVELAKSFHVEYDTVSRIPTLVQAGYATGLVLISPLGDLVRRRQLTLALVIVSTTLTIGLAVTSSLPVFESLSFLVGVVTVTPQILLPLAADLAPPERRASAISVVLGGLLFGILLARTISGIIAEFITWRVVYYLAIGLQSLVLAGSYLLLPDYPPRNPESGLTYFDILWTMAKYAVTEPTLVQASLINFASSACFSCFWVTLTFLLDGEPYNYSTLVIGLFGLIGLFGVGMSPLVGKLIDSEPLRKGPWYATLYAVLGQLVFQVVHLIGGGLHISAVIIAILGMDVFRQMCQVGLTNWVFGVAPEARARMNAVLILAIFLGQVLGTSAGTHVFLHYGWRASAALMVGWTGSELLVLGVRGPGGGRWKWVGGWSRVGGEKVKDTGTSDSGKS